MRVRLLLRYHNPNGSDESNSLIGSAECQASPYHGPNAASPLNDGLDPTIVLIQPSPATHRPMLEKVDYRTVCAADLVEILGAIRQRMMWRVKRSLPRTDRKLVTAYLERATTPMLHIGCGKNTLDHWLNTDFFPDDSDVMHLDATRAFPLEDNSFDYIFTEHMIEHVSYCDGLSMLRECCRVLKDGGKIRITTPDLRFLIDLYGVDKSDLQQNYIKWASDAFVKPTGELDDTFVINNFVRAWDHEFIYDEKTMRSSLVKSGFTDIVRCELGISDHEPLRHLENESRIPPGFLALESMTLEATKNAGRQASEEVSGE